MGYEKPHPNIFRYVLDKYKGDYSEIWMVGDDISADIRGAESMGIKAILVRGIEKEQIRYYSKDLWGVRDIIFNFNIMGRK
ncbi:MAG: HAD family hydrolase [Clostridium sp.]